MQICKNRTDDTKTRDVEYAVGYGGPRTIQTTCRVVLCSANLLFGCCQRRFWTLLAAAPEAGLRALQYQGEPTVVKHGAGSPLCAELF
jgi:hypothetical protein